MLGSLRQWLRPPALAGADEQTQAATMLHWISVTLGTLVLVVGLATATLHGPQRLLGPAVTLIIVALTQILLRRGQAMAAGAVFVTSLWFMGVSWVYISGGVSSPGYSALIVLVVIAGLAIGPRAAITFALGSIAAGAIMLVVEQHGALPSSRVVHSPQTMWLNTSGGLIIAAVVLNLATRSARKFRAMAEARARETEAMERRMLEAQKLESLGQLAAGVAHDFNNLLTVIRGGVDFLSEAELEPEYRDDLAQVQRAVDRAAAMIRQLLAFSRGQVLEPRSLDTGEALERVASLLRRMLGEQITLERDVAPDTWPLRADPTQLEQLLMNLCINARDAMPEGGRILLRAANHRAGARDYVRLSVIDEGQGMTEATRQRLFEPFYTTKRPGRGTGLGLAVVRGIVEQSHGAVTVESELGRGTTFHVDLPRGSTADLARLAGQADAGQPEGRPPDPRDR